MIVEKINNSQKQEKKNKTAAIDLYNIHNKETDYEYK